MGIYELLPKLMGEIGPISKDHRGAQGYKFRGVDDVLNAMHPAMVKLGLCLEVKCHDRITETTIEDGQKKRFVYRVLLLMDVSFIAPDGSRITHTGAGEGLDIASDKATNKAMSAAFKYACFLGLCIPVDDDTLTDSDATGRLVGPAAEVAPQVIPTLPNLPAAGITLQASGPKVTETVQAQIQELVVSLGVPPDVILGLWAQHGVQYLYDLPAKAGDEILAKLKRLDLDRQASQTFSPG